ncbi:glycosyltransferase family 39 protein [Roseibium sp.]|uniref:glycosyltransferase family 39 protein n=2 Tax=Roseibium sp. TaxID=1936156 RepID=UPI00326584EE
MAVDSENLVTEDKQTAVLVNLIWMLVFAVLVMLTQIGSLSTEVLDWDESTFALMAQSVARGHLPFVELFDLKPPVLFLALGGWMSVFGDTLWSLRAFGDACLLVICCFTFLTASRSAGAFSAGLGTLFLISLSASGFAQHTQTEHLAMAFLMPAVYLASSPSLTPARLAAAGLLVSLAVLTRSNLGLVAVTLGIYLLIVLRGQGMRGAAGRVSSYIVGGMVPVVLLVGVYAAQGELATLKLAMIDAPISYASREDGSIMNTLSAHAVYWGGRILHEPLLFASATLVLAGAFVVLAIQLPGRSGRTYLLGERTVLATGFVLIAVLLSIILGGAAYSHYWNQVFPLLAVLVACGISRATGSRIVHGAGVAGVLVMVAGALAITLPSAIGVFENRGRLQDAHFVQKAARVILASDIADKRVWAMNYQIVHMYLNSVPLSRALTHPANINPDSSVYRPLADAGYVSGDEVGRLMDLKPAFIVAKDMPPWYFSETTGARVGSWIEENYTVYRQLGDLVIYLHKDHAG